MGSAFSSTQSWALNLNLKWEDNDLSKQPAMTSRNGEKMSRRVPIVIPPSYDEIDVNLWLGNLSAATNLEILEKHHINHILTVDSVPLPRKITDRSELTFMFIKLTDLATEDIISHFEDAYDFIDKGVKNGVVLVHCYCGVSRSSTLVVAYLMKRHKMPFKEALELVSSKRVCVGPNTGFRAQLRLYESMNFELNREHVQYRMFRLHVAADQIKKAKILPKEFSDIIKPDPALERAQPDPLGYRCRKCRRMVALAKNILPHYVNQKYSWSDVQGQACRKIIFVEPIAWMKNVGHSLEGKLNCVKCQAKLGSFSWIMGCQCHCGTKVQPAFYLIPSKVDITNSVKNLEATV